MCRSQQAGRRTAGATDFARTANCVRATETDGRSPGAPMTSLLTRVQPNLNAHLNACCLFLLAARPDAQAAAAVPSAAELQGQMETAIRSHAATFAVPAGAYNFSSDNFNISGASGMRIAGAGATLWFSQTAGVNISNSDNLHISGLSIDYSNLPRTRSGIPAVTYNLLNCSDVISEDITIYKAPFFSVTAFNGGGGHVFRRFRLPNDTTVDPESGRPVDPWPHERDAFHFTDLRRGVIVEDSHASGFGDDFFVSMQLYMYTNFSNFTAYRITGAPLPVCGVELAQHRDGGLEEGVADIVARDQPTPAECKEESGAREHHCKQEHRV